MSQFTQRPCHIRRQIGSTVNACRNNRHGTHARTPRATARALKHGGRATLRRPRRKNRFTQHKKKVALVPVPTTLNPPPVKSVKRKATSDDNDLSNSGGGCSPPPPPRKGRRWGDGDPALGKIPKSQGATSPRQSIHQIAPEGDAPPEAGGTAPRSSGATGPRAACPPRRPYER